MQARTQSDVEISLRRDATSLVVFEHYDSAQHYPIIAFCINETLHTVFPLCGHHHHHFICAIIQHYAHLQFRRAGHQGLTRTLTAALKRWTCNSKGRGFMVILTSCISSSVNCTSPSMCFSERVRPITLWNSLPGDRVNFSSLHKCKSSLKSIDPLSLVHQSLFPACVVMLLVIFMFVCLCV